MLDSKLADSLNTFFGSSRSTLNNLIREMKLDKTDFQSLVSKLASSSRFSDFSSAQIAEYSPLQREPVIDLFRDSSLRMNQLFSAANSGGVVIDSMVSVLSTEIDKIEKDLQNLQLFIDNYEFIAGKDDLYNVNYLEKFDNILNDYRSDGYDFIVPDRDGVNFPIGGNAFVDSVSGVLKIGSGQLTKNVLKNIREIKTLSNYEHYVTTSTSFENLFNDLFKDSWTVTVKSPSVLDAQISAYSNYIPYDITNLKGAKTVVELSFHSTVSMDTIRINPNIGNNLQLLQIVLFNSSVGYVTATNTKENFKTILTASKIINNTVEIGFEKSAVDKIIFIFNQGSYNRTRKQPEMAELNSKALDHFVRQRMTEKRTSFSMVQDLAYWYFRKNFLIDGLKQNKKNDLEYYSYRFPQELHSYAQLVENEIFKASQYSLEDNIAFVSTPLFVDLVRNMLASMNVDMKFFDSNYFVETSSITSKATQYDNPGFLSVKNSDDLNDPKYQFYNDSVGLGTMKDVLRNLLVQEPEDFYEYLFSLKSIEFIETQTTGMDKACFVSKKIPADGHVLAVKAKSSVIDVNTVAGQSNYDLDNFASYELSISNEEYPTRESDWIPIAFNDQTFIDSEVVFFDVSDYSSRLRFIPKADSIVLYKDGKLVQADSYTYKPASNQIQITDITKFSPTSIFCASYLIDLAVANPYEIDFVKRNVYKESIRQATNSSGLGEIFQKTSADGTITLSFSPYVNKTFVNGTRSNPDDPGSSFINSARYDTFFGTIFNTNDSAGYSPVKVKLADGSFATNITNYTNTAQSVSFNGTSTVQFIQNGNTISFNQTINAPFTVYYEYVPYNLRFRMVMRKNIPNLEVPARADSVLLKMKTTYFDPYYDKLNYISKG